MPFIPRVLISYILLPAHPPPSPTQGLSLISHPLGSTNITFHPQVGPHVRGSTHTTWPGSQSGRSSLNKHFLGPYYEPNTLLSTRDQAVSKQAKSIPSWSLHSSGRCQLQIGACYLPLQGLSCATAAADFQHPLKGAQGGEQKWGTLCSGKNWRNSSSDRYFQEPILWDQFLISRKALKSFVVTSALCD